MAEREEPLVSTSEAARQLGIGHRTLNTWVQQGDVEPDFTTVGGHYRFKVSHLREQIERMHERGGHDQG